MNSSRNNRPPGLLPLPVEAEDVPAEHLLVSDAPAGAPDVQPGTSSLRGVHPDHRTGRLEDCVAERQETAGPEWCCLCQDQEPLPVVFSHAESGMPVPRIPEGIPDDEGTSLGTLAAVLAAYHGTIPASLRDEYVRQLMKFAGETAGTFIRMCSEPML